MKRFDDEDLIAHSLHELPPRKAAALERALQTDPTLAARYEAYVTMLRDFKAGAATTVFDEDLIARNWRALQPSLASSRVRSVMPSRWHYPVLAGAGLALAATAFFLAPRPHDAPRSHDIASLPHPSPLSRTQRSESAPVGDIAVGASSGVPSSQEQASVQQRSHAARPLLPLRTEASQTLPPRMTASLQLGTENATALHFIPLASTSLPALPILLPPFVLPTSPPQAVAPQVLSGSGHARTYAHPRHPTDLTFAMGGVLIGTREVSGPGTAVHILGATHAVSALAAFHQQLRPAVGYRIAVSYARPDFQYEYKDATTSGSEGDIDGRVYELAATYVVQGPHRGSLSTSAEAGGGLMAFLPTLQSTETSYNLRGAAVAGIAADYALSKHLRLHAAYCAQVYTGPDFKYSGINKSVVTTTFLSNEPMVGITYRFHSK